MKSNKKALLTIFTTNFLDMLSFGLVLPVFGFLFEPDAIFSGIYNESELNFRYLLMVGSFSVGALIGAPVVGALSDRFGRKNLLYFTYSTQACFYVLFVLGILSVNYWFLFTARFLGGALGGALLVVQSSIADVSAPKDRAKNFGLTGIAFGLGFIIGASCGAYLSDPNNASWFGYTIPFYVSIVVTLFNLVFLTFAYKETLLNKSKKHISVLTGPQNVIKAFSTPSLRDIFIVIFLITVSLNFLLQLYQFYARINLGFSMTEVGSLFAFIGISIAIAQGVVLPYFTKRFKPKPLLTWFLPIFAITYLVLLLPRSHFMFLVPTFVLLVCQGITFPTTLAVVSNQAEEDVQGETMGINQAVQSAAAASPIAVAAFFDIAYDWPMYFGAAATGLAWLYFLWAFNVKKRPK